MKVAIDISKDQAAQLNSEAEKLGVSPEALAKAAVVDMLERKEDFASAARYVLAKNRELYERLS
ncbi:MAG: DNA-binding protein [Acidobacteriota bacterium]